MTYAIITFYLSGIVVAYLYEKRHVQDIFGSYAVSDRTHNLVTCIFSWIAVLSTYMTDKKNDNDDKEANW